MRNRMLWTLTLIAAVLAAGSSARAQWRENRLEFTPFVGYETPGSFPISDPLNNGVGTFRDRLRADGGLNYGAFLDYSITRHAQFEFGWNRNSTTFRERLAPNPVFVKAFDSDIDQYQFGMLYMFTGNDHKIRPYFAAGVGFEHEFNSGLTPNRTDFAYNLGGGVKYMFTRHLGFRADARYVPAYKNSSTEIECDPFGFCFPARVAHFLNRGNFTTGLVLRF
jgi:opacity protein-like surface antigen